MWTPFWFSDGRRFCREQELKAETRLSERTVESLEQAPTTTGEKEAIIRNGVVARPRVLLRELAVLMHLSKHDLPTAWIGF